MVVSLGERAARVVKEAPAREFSPGGGRRGLTAIAIAVLGALFIGGFALGAFIFSSDRVIHISGESGNTESLLGAARETLEEVFSGDSASGTEDRIPLEDSRRAAYGTDTSRVGGEVLGDEAEQAGVEPADATSAAKTVQIAGSGGLANPSGNGNQAGTPVETPVCAFGTPLSPLRTVIVNEIAWMGSPQRDGASAGQAAADEWIELKNISAGSISLAGAQIADQDGKFRITFPDDASIAPGGYYLLERTDDATVPGVPADHVYTGSLANNGMWLRLFGGNCDLWDEVNALGGWQAGDAATRATMERTADGAGWQTSAVSGGTPRAANSTPQIAAPPTASSTPEPAPTSSEPLTNFHVTIYKEGEGTGHVVSSPAGIDCGDTCSYNFPYGSSVLLTAEPDTASYQFGGWSSPCDRLGQCGFTVQGDTYIVAKFLLANQTVASGGEGEVAGAQSPSAQISINEVMAGSSANVNDEFVELYNPTAAAVNLTGWTMRKRSSTGSESAFISAARFENISIPAQGYLLLAHTDAYNGSVQPDVLWPGSYSLAYTNNALVLVAPDGAVVDDVPWAEIDPDESYARTTPGGNAFDLGAPTPHNAAGQ
jgi:hypothetical protein